MNSTVPASSATPAIHPALLPILLQAFAGPKCRSSSACRDSTASIWRSFPLAGSAPIGLNAAVELCLHVAVVRKRLPAVTYRAVSDFGAAPVCPAVQGEPTVE